MGAVATWSAVRGPRFYDGLAETSDRGFISFCRLFRLFFVHFVPIDSEGRKHNLLIRLT